MSKALTLAIVFVFLTTFCIVVDMPVSGTTGAENTWVEKTPMHQARDVLGVASVNGKIYAIGGTDLTYHSDTGTGQTGGVVGTNEEYDPNTNSWTTKTPMPTPNSGFATAVYRGKIYCIDGTTNQVYNPNNDTWETKTPIPIETYYPKANVVNGKIYVFNRTSNWVYDPTTDVWSAKSPMPSKLSPWGVSAAVSPFYVAVVVDTKIYVMGSAGDYSIMLIYDTENDTWSQGSHPSRSVGFWTFGVATTGVLAPKRIFLVGFQSDIPTKPGVQVYDPKMDSWENAAGLSVTRVVGGITEVDDRLYAIGGTSSVENTLFDTTYVRSAEVELYTPIGYGTPDPATNPTPSITSPTPTPTVPELQSWTISLLLTIIVASAGLLVYHKKQRHSLDAV